MIGSVKIIHFSIIKKLDLVAHVVNSFVNCVRNIVPTPVPITSNSIKSNIMYNMDRLTSWHFDVNVHNEWNLGWCFSLLIPGLISDAFHMFFDCTGLLFGLAASMITKWKANDKYSYGYVRAEVLVGFGNSLFLLFIAFFIMSEAVERAIEPPEVRCSTYWKTIFSF